MTALQPEPGDVADPSVLVVVVTAPTDLDRALQQGWYRIPLARAPARIAVDYLAFYQTGAFPEGERWQVRWYAPVTDYRIVRRRDLLPEEPEHPRADDRYYRVGIGPPTALPCPVPSRRLRRITEIPTTLSRLRAAGEINDLWIKTGAAERLWQAFRQADLDAECNFEIAECGASYVADFVLPCRNGTVAVDIDQSAEIALWLHEERTSYQERLPEGWIRRRIPATSHPAELHDHVVQLKNLVQTLGGLA